LIRSWVSAFEPRHDNVVLHRVNWVEVFEALIDEVSEIPVKVGTAR
jgi:hypothetical protein